MKAPMKQIEERNTTRRECARAARRARMKSQRSKRPAVAASSEVGRVEAWWVAGAESGETVVAGDVYEACEQRERSDSAVPWWI